MKEGYTANGTKWKVHLDGYNFAPYFRDEEEKGPRESYFYFGMDGTLNAVRWNDFKAHFNVQMGPNNPLNGSYMVTPNAPLVYYLRADPFERAQWDSGAWEVFAMDQLWVFVPLQEAIKNFLITIPQYPYQTGSSLTASGINYDLFRRPMRCSNCRISRSVWTSWELVQGRAVDQASSGNGSIAIRIQLS